MVWLGGSLALLGCRTSAPQTVMVPAPLTSPEPASWPTSNPAPRVESDPAQLPKLSSKVPVRSAEVSLFTEAQVRERAAAYALFGQTDAEPGTTSYHIAAEARLRAVSTALGQYYQLASLIGRIEVLEETMKLLEDVEKQLSQAKADGVKLPTEMETLPRRKLELRNSLIQAELGYDLLQTDLKRRLGLKPESPRIHPHELPTISLDLEPLSEALAHAQESRPDLLALRAAYLSFTPETLPSAREILERYGPPLPPFVQSRVDRQFDRTTVNSTLLAEFAVRRQQLFTLIGERERQAADEVRAADLAWQSQARQVSLVQERWQAANAKVESSRGQGLFFETPAKLELLQSRAELHDAVMQLHLTRTKRETATGR
ncbi:MAG: hypothetical protein ACRC8S_00795 [Fimbriiglobus sp.]